MFGGIHRPPVQVVDIIWPVGMELLQLQFCFGPFWTHKIKTKVKYENISNILHLLSTPDSDPCAEPVLASLVVTSKCSSKFLLSAILSLIVVS